MVLRLAGQARYNLNPNPKRSGTLTEPEPLPSPNPNPELLPSPNPSASPNPARGAGRHRQAGAGGADRARGRRQAEASRGGRLPRTPPCPRRRCAALRCAASDSSSAAAVPRCLGAYCTARADLPLPFARRYHRGRGGAAEGGPAGRQLPDRLRCVRQPVARRRPGHCT